MFRPIPSQIICCRCPKCQYFSIRQQSPNLMFGQSARCPRCGDMMQIEAPIPTLLKKLKKWFKSTHPRP